MSSPVVKTIDGNEAAAYVAHKVSEVCIIYPITPSSPMGEHADAWSAMDTPNIWGTVPDVVEMQSEGGAAGAIHGALQAGSMGATFTASQGLLLMIPNMYKVAGELTPSVFHVSARSLAAQALSIFGDHSDVMSCRQTGFAMLASNTVQEALDMSMIAHTATLESRIPFMHFFDGFRTSHEVSKIEMIDDDVIKTMIDDELVFQHRKNSLNPENPVVRGTAQNPDVYFQGRETVNKFYDATPGIVEKAMRKYEGLTGRKYDLFDYYGAEDAEKVIIATGSGMGPIQEMVDVMVANGEKVAAINCRLYRPFSIAHFIAALPKTLKSIAVLDRTKEPGATGEPLYLDIVTALAESVSEGKLNVMPKVIGGRYGLSSKEFTPTMVKAIFAELDKAAPKNHFTIGINDDVTHTSLDYDKDYQIESDKVVRSMFYGLGSDGTVGANKNSIKIIGGETDNYAQGYFVYDSKKAGAVTVSHLRFGPEPIRSNYLIQSANFVACHQFQFTEQIDMLKEICNGGTFLLNSTYGADEIWDHLPKAVQSDIINKNLKFYIVDGYKVAEESGMGTRINTIMQTCFFAISGILPQDEAIAKIKEAIKKTYGKKGDDIVNMNYAAVDNSLANLIQVDVPAAVSSTFDVRPVVPAEAPEFVQSVTAMIMARKGDDLPVSAMPVDGTWPTATTKWEKRNVALSVPVWEEDMCIQCGNCSMICPHSVIGVKSAPCSELEAAPAGFKSAAIKGKNAPEDRKYTLQIAIEDCTGCGLCVDACPVKSKTEEGKRAINMTEKMPIIEDGIKHYDFYKTLSNIDRSEMDLETVKGVQYAQSLFEFSGACAGCGETPYVSLATQLFGDRMIIANATGCSSIYGGNLPTTPYAVDANGRGPTWSNSLFEDNAEFGFGFRVSIDKQTEFALELCQKMGEQIGYDLVNDIVAADQKTEAGIAAQRDRVEKLAGILKGIDSSDARQLESLKDNLVKRSVWIFGGDGWAYDIGFGGLDHVFASGRNVNILVMDTEVYSNTGGQMSKATPRAAVAKFAAGGKRTGKKDLGMIAAGYGNVYVAQVAMGSNPRQVIKAFKEAEAHDGVSIILAYSHCIAHGIQMIDGPTQQDKAVKSGHWPLFRYNPALADEGKNPFVLESKDPSITLKEYAYNETRYKMLARSKPEIAAQLIEEGQEDVNRRWKAYKKLASGEA